MQIQRSSPLVWLAALLASAAGAGGRTDIEIVPGPTMMSAAEHALAPDPVAGTEHAEILVLEYERDEDHAADSLYHFHMRAKIHSLEARDLADVEINHRAGHDRIMRWWGRTIMPDGTVHELSEKQLDQQLLARVGDAATRTVKAALPGVVPGCVIDYGFTVKVESAFLAYHEISLQRDHRIASFRYRWVPSRGLAYGYRVRKGDGLDLSLDRDRDSVLVVGRDLPPLALEAMMPPTDALAATAILYYWDNRSGTKDFWNYEAKLRAGRERLSEEVVAAIAEIGLDPSAPVERRLRALYAWTLASIENTTLLSPEVVEARAFADDPALGKTVLQRHAGTASQIDRLLVELARAAGAEAFLVLAADRRIRLWDPGLYSMDQFSETLVAARDPAAPESSYVFLDPGSAMPYGDVPWWVTGSEALLARKSGAEVVFIPPATASRNVREIRASVSFGEQGQPANASWSVRGTGQVGRSEMSWLRGLVPSERPRALAERCGAGPEVDVQSAEAPTLDVVTADSRLECAAEIQDLALDKPYGRYLYDSRGPWSRRLPDFPPGTRVHPVVFDYPYVEATTLDVAPPPGMRPGALPEPVQVDSPYGRYQRQVSLVEGKLRDARKLAIVTLAVPPGEYEALREFRGKVELAEATPLEFVREAPP